MDSKTEKQQLSVLDEFAMRFAPELIERNTGCGTNWEHVARDAYNAAEAMLHESKMRNRKTTN